MTLLSVAIGGALGASMRYLAAGWTMRAFGPGFPAGTMVVNVLGSFVMGVCAVLMLHRMPESWGRFAPFVMTGVLGGFTTFSAFSLDALFLMERGRHVAAAAYIGGSVVLSIAALALGLAVARGAFS